MARGRGSRRGRQTKGPHKPTLKVPNIAGYADVYYKNLTSQLFDKPYMDRGKSLVTTGVPSRGRVNMNF